MKKWVKESFRENAKSRESVGKCERREIGFLGFFLQGDAEKEYYIIPPHTYHTCICIVKIGVIVLFTGRESERGIRERRYCKNRQRKAEDDKRRKTLSDVQKGRWCSLIFFCVTEKYSMSIKENNILTLQQQPIVQLGKTSSWNGDIHKQYDPPTACTCVPEHITFSFVLLCTTRYILPVVHGSNVTHFLFFKLKMSVRMPCK